jgi:hypothetical protein
VTVQGALCNDVVEEHRVHSPAHKVAVGVHVVIVRHRHEAERVARLEQQIIRDGRAEGRNTAPAEIGEAVSALGVLRPDGQNFAKLKVGNRDGMAGAAGRRLFHAGEAEREIAALHRLIDVGPLDLNKAGAASAQSSGDPGRDVDVEAPHARRVGRVGFDERGTAFRVAAPHEHRLLRRQGARQCQGTDHGGRRCP